MLKPATLIWCQAPSAAIVMPGKGVMLGKLVVPWNVVCRLILMMWFVPSVGSSLTHTLRLYSEPGYILLLTLICGPSKLAVRPVVSRLCVPPCAAAVVLVTVELPERELHPSSPPSSNVDVIPVLSCWLAFGGADESSPITTSLM